MISTKNKIKLEGSCIQKLKYCSKYAVDSQELDQFYERTESSNASETVVDQTPKDIRAVKSTPQIKTLEETKREHVVFDKQVQIFDQRTHRESGFVTSLRKNKYGQKITNSMSPMTREILQNSKHLGTEGDDGEVAAAKTETENLTASSASSTRNQRAPSLSQPKKGIIKSRRQDEHPVAGEEVKTGILSRRRSEENSTNSQTTVLSFHSHNFRPVDRQLRTERTEAGKALNDPIIARQRIQYLPSQSTHGKSFSPTKLERRLDQSSVEQPIKPLKSTRNRTAANNLEIEQAKNQLHKLKAKLVSSLHLANSLSNLPNDPKLITNSQIQSIIKAADEKPKSVKKSSATLSNQIKDLEDKFDVLTEIIRSKFPSKLLSIANGQTHIGQQFVSNCQFSAREEKENTQHHFVSAAHSQFHSTQSPLKEIRSDRNFTFGTERKHRSPMVDRLSELNSLPLQYERNNSNLTESNETAIVSANKIKRRLKSFSFLSAVAQSQMNNLNIDN